MLKSLITNAIITFSVCLLFACATSVSAPGNGQGERVANVEYPLDKSVIYIYRPKNYFTANSGLLRTFIDGIEVTELDQGEHLVLYVEPGDHLISSDMVTKSALYPTPTPGEVLLTVSAESEYFVKINLGLGSINRDKIKINIVSSEQAQKSLRSSALIFGSDPESVESNSLSEFNQVNTKKNRDMSSTAWVEEAREVLETSKRELRSQSDDSEDNRPKTMGQVIEEQQKSEIARITNALKNNPKSADLYFQRAGAYFLIDEYEKALNDYGQAIEIDPMFARAYEGRADVYFRLSTKDSNQKNEYIERATKELNKAEKIDPDIFLDQKNRGFGYFQTEDREKFVYPAVDTFKRHREGTLILGEATMSNVVNLLAPWPGYLPNHKRIESSRVVKGKVGDVQKKIRYSYNPRIAGDHIFYFNKNHKLIVIYLQFGMFGIQNEQERLNIERNVNALIQEFNFVEIPSKETDITQFSGELSRCITVDIHFLENSNDAHSIAYYYTCN